LETVIEEAAAGGARWFWLRDRDLEKSERFCLARRLAEIVKRCGGVLCIGADIDLARELGTDAVHLRVLSDIAEARRVLGANALVGFSAHSLADVVAAQASGADYVTLSPIYPTASKPGYGPALGVDAIRAAAGVGIPVVALGGITCETTPLVRNAGAAGIAVMGEIMRAPDAATVVGRLLTAP